MGGQLDNGRGLARGHCFRHKHEVDNGQTSSVSQLTLGFGTNGSVTNYSSVRPHTQEEVLKESSKLVTFVDLCGHGLWSGSVRRERGRAEDDEGAHRTTTRSTST